METNVFIKHWLQLFPILVLLPYLLTGVVNGYVVALNENKPDMNAYLSLIVYEQIEKSNICDMQEEAVKVQAIIARSNFYRELKNGDLTYILREEMDHKTSDHKTISGKIRRIKDIEKIRDCYSALEKTEDIVLVHQEKLKPVPYHVLSNGKTRDGEEVFHDEYFSYLKSVDSAEDKESEEYFNRVYVPRKKLPDELSLKDMDQAGYIVSIKSGRQLLEAESFRRSFGINSSDFEIKCGKKYICFFSKGKGHGLGYSQYGGNEKAKKGCTYKEIIEWYFPEMNIMDYKVF